MRKRHVIWFALLLAAELLLPASPALAEGNPPDDGITVWGEDYTVHEGEHLDGDLVVFGGSAFLELDSRVEGSVIVWNGDADVDGTIESDLVVTNGDITLGDDACVEGNVVCSWNCDIEQAEGARVEGTVIDGVSPPMLDFRFLPDFRFERDRDFRMPFPVNGWAAAPGAVLRWAFRLIRGVASILVIAVVAGLVALIWPGQTARIGRTVAEAPGPTFGIGLLAALAAVAAIIVLAITICLVPTAILIALALGIAGLFGWIAVGALLGERLLETFNAREVAPMWAAGLGTLVISLVSAGLGLVRCLGILGAIATLVLGCMGLGAVVLTRFGTTRYAPSRPTLSQPVPEPAIQFTGTSDESDESSAEGAAEEEDVAKQAEDSET